MLGAGEGEIGALQTAQTLPFLLMSMPAGVLANRMSRARLMAGAESQRAGSLVAVLMLVMFGVGMVAGALSAARVMRTLRLGTVIAIGPVAGLAAALLMVLTIWTPTPALAAASFFVMGAGPILWVVSTTTLRQTVTPRDLLGRVSAINSVAYGARPLGAAIGAVCGGLLGAQACLIVAAAGFLLQAAVLLTSPVPSLERQPDMAR